MSPGQVEGHEELRAAVRGYFSRHQPLASTRSRVASGALLDREAWKRMAGELGLLGLAIPEHLGGQGYGLAELGIVFEEAGRLLVGAPLLGTVLATTVLSALDDAEAQGSLLPRIADGSLLVTIAVQESHSGWDPTRCATRAKASDGGFSITGEKPWVLDGDSADVLLVVADTDEGPTLFCVEIAADGVYRQALRTLDITRGQASFSFAEASARRIGPLGGAGPVVEHALDVARAMVALEMAAGAQRCLDLTVDYVTLRRAFGRAVGSFQAVKHRCADMLVAVESAGVAAEHAVRTVTQAPHEFPTAAVMAKIVAGEAYRMCAASTIQLHGGIGFTWDHDAHLYYRRAQADTLLFGDVIAERELLARRLAI